MPLAGASMMRTALRIGEISASRNAVMTVEGQRNHDLALSQSKGGRGLQARFDKVSTGLEG